MFKFAISEQTTGFEPVSPSRKNCQSQLGVNGQGLLADAVLGCWVLSSEKRLTADVKTRVKAP